MQAEEQAKKPGHVFVCSGGKISTLYTDAMPLKELGQMAIKRASHVDGSADLTPVAVEWLWSHQPDLFQPQSSVALREQLGFDKWWADLLPSGGPVLGPFDTRQAALDAEVAWLREHMFHVEG